MADGTVLNTGTGGDTIQTEQPGGTGVKYPVTKIYTGALDVNGGPVTTTNPFDVRIGDTSNTASVFPATFLRTSDEPRQLFYDPFDSTLDTTNRWSAPVTTNSGVAAAVALGVLTLGTGTVANGTSVLLSQPSHSPTVPSWLGVSFAIKVESPLVINGTRFWGTGTKPATPAAGAMVTDGYGFEIDAAGKLAAVVYAAGVRTLIQDLSSSGNSKQPTDANMHRYIVYYRTDKIYWYIDTIAGAPVATSSFQSPNVQTLPVNFTCVAGATPPVSSDVITCTGLAVWDTGKNNTQISDGTFPWRKAAVSAAGALSVNPQAGSSIKVTDGTNFLPTMDVVARKAFVALTDGTNTAAVKAASTAAVATDPALVVALSPNNNTLANALVTKLSDGTNTTAVKAASTAAAAADPAVVVSLSPNSPVAMAALTKGTQNATGVSTQDLKDSGRVNICATAVDQALTAATETMITMSVSRDGAAVATATSNVITSGKRFRITSITVFAEAGGSVPVSARVSVRLRFAATGGAINTSPLQVLLKMPLLGATAKTVVSQFEDFPDGIEFLGDGTKAWGLSVLCPEWAATTELPTVSVSLFGFEY